MAARPDKLYEPVEASSVPLVEVLVSEPLTATTTPWLAARLAEALRLRPQQLVVDLSACPSIDAASIAVLLETHRRIRREGGYLTLRGPSDRLRRNLDLARATDVLPVVPEGR